jgi:hypothetical protein
VVSEINKHIDGNANIIFGAAADEEMEGKISVSLIVTGPWEPGSNAAATPMTSAAETTTHTSNIAAPVSVVAEEPAPEVWRSNINNTQRDKCISHTHSLATLCTIRHHDQRNQHKQSQ